MEEKKLYRNAIRSRQMIRKAFMELLEEKPVEKITATDIINRAGINRSTFYAHYPDAKGLLDEILDDIGSIFQKLLLNIDFSSFFDDPMPILQMVIDFLNENQNLYKMLSRSRMAPGVLDSLKRSLIQQVLSCPNLPVQDPNSPATEIRVRILLGGLIDAYRQWLEGDFICTLEEATREIALIIRLWGKESMNSDP